ncbi:MAG: copper chaperone [Ignavibacteriales bacterium CG_4_9_14_3_um_filter_30_11]|nr:MAG: copper chaperone [Ignavibacteriales bacterium CG_4_9_14_3_um_filter_30_11]
METEKLIIEGMSCGHCVMAVKKELSKLDIKIKNVVIGSAEIEFDPNKIESTELEEAVNNSGFKLIEVISP